MNESQELLKKQTTENYKLFKNGVINVLQLVDILSRQVGLINQMNSSYFELLHFNALYIVNSNYEVKNG